MARSSNRTRQWSELLHWLKRFRADPDFEKEERTYKVALAARSQRGAQAHPIRTGRLGGTRFAVPSPTRTII